MWNSIDTFKGRINKGDEVVFYYAGHGVQIKSNQLLLPVDISAVNDSQVQRDAVSLVDVQDALKDARFALLVIDACRDNPFPKSGGRSIGGGTRGLLPPEPVTGQVIVMSAGRNQKALDSVPGETAANGLFTWALAQAIQGPGMEIRVALEQVKDQVDDIAKSVGHDQRPGMVSDLRGNFYFFGPTTVQVQGGTSPSDPETRTWDAAETANTESAYQTYLDSYPKGRFVGAAKIKMDALKQTAVQMPMPTKPPPAASTDPETAFWNEVKANGAREYLDAYFKQYSKGKYLVLAKIELKKLDDKELAERDRHAAQRSQEEQSAWDNAKRLGTQAAYSSYLGSYPTGQFVTLAQAAQQKLKREAEDGKEALLVQSRLVESTETRIQGVAVANEASNLPPQEKFTNLSTPRPLPPIASHLGPAAEKPSSQARSNGEVVGTLEMKDPLTSILTSLEVRVLENNAERTLYSTGDSIGKNGTVMQVRFGEVVLRVFSGALWTTPIKAGQSGKATVLVDGADGTGEINWKTLDMGEGRIQVAVDGWYPARSGAYIKFLIGQWTGIYSSAQSLPESTVTWFKADNYVGNLSSSILRLR